MVALFLPDCRRRDQAPPFVSGAFGRTARPLVRFVRWLRSFPTVFQSENAGQRDGRRVRFVRVLVERDAWIYDFVFVSSFYSNVVKAAFDRKSTATTCWERVECLADHHVWAKNTSKSILQWCSCARAKNIWDSFDMGWVKVHGKVTSDGDSLPSFPRCSDPIPFPSSFF